MTSCLPLLWPQLLQIKIHKKMNALLLMDRRASGKESIHVIRIFAELLNLWRKQSRFASNASEEDVSLQGGKPFFPQCGNHLSFPRMAISLRKVASLALPSHPLTSPNNRSFQTLPAEVCERIISVVKERHLLDQKTLPLLSSLPWLPCLYLK